MRTRRQRAWRSRISERWQAETVPLQNAKILLAKIQRYADASYLVTQQHIAEVSKLTTVAEVTAYGITAGYPEKLSF